MANFVLTGTIVRLDGTPWANAPVRLLNLLPVADGTAPPDSVLKSTGNDGTFGIAAVARTSGVTPWRLILPDGTQADFDHAAGTTTLQAILEAPGTVIAGPQAAVGGVVGPQGPQGPAGATGPSGVVAATAPLSYNSGTQTVALQASATDRVFGRSSSGAGNAEEIVFTAAARSLVDDADAAAMRATLAAPGLSTANLFTQRQDVRASGSGVAAVLHVPWQSGDTLPGVVAGATTSGNNQTAISADSHSGSGVRSASQTGTGLQAESQSGAALLAQINPSVTNGLNDLAFWRANCSGTAANGFGLTHRFQLEDAAGNLRSAGYLSALWRDAAAASSDLSFATTNAGSQAEQARLTAAGQWLIRSTDNAQAAALYAPGVAGDTLPTAILGSSAGPQSALVLANGSNSQAAMRVTNSGTAYAATFTNTTANTSAPVAGAAFIHNSTATPAPGFGIAFEFAGKSSTSNSQSMGQINAEWEVATHASRRSRFRFYAFDAAGAREALRLSTSGSAPTIGFLSAASSPAAQQTGGVATASGTYGATEQDMLQKAYNALRTFGLLS